MILYSEFSSMLVLVNLCTTGSVACIVGADIAETFGCARILGAEIGLLLGEVSAIASNMKYSYMIDANILNQIN